MQTLHRQPCGAVHLTKTKWILLRGGGGFPEECSRRTPPMTHRRTPYSGSVASGETPQMESVFPRPSILEAGQPLHHLRSRRPIVQEHRNAFQILALGIRRHRHHHCHPHRRPRRPPHRRRRRLRHPYCLVPMRLVSPTPYFRTRGTMSLPSSADRQL